MISDLRFGTRTAVFAAYTMGTLGWFEVHVRAKRSPLDEQEALIRTTMRRYGRDMCKLFGVRIDAEGLGPEGFVSGSDAAGKGRVFVSNHRSGLDILVTLALLEGKHLSRADLAKWPVIGVIARRAGILFVDRENRRSSAASIHEMIHRVDSGSAVIIFPEGTTFEGDEVRPFKPGALAVARRTGCEIVPLGIAYAQSDSFGDESFLNHMRRVAGAPQTQVAVTVGEPFRPEGTDTAALSNRARDAVQALVHASRARIRSDPGSSGG